MARLAHCKFLAENDYDYLVSESDWIQRVTSKSLMNTYEVDQLRKLMADIARNDITYINELFNIGVLKCYFTKADFSYSHRQNNTNISGTASQDKFQIKAAFISTIIRHLIMREWSENTGKDDRDGFLERYPFLNEEIGSNIELTWLNRFERSLRCLKRYIPAERNKILYLTVGNHLEGSTVYTTYITGGANRPETERRVKIFDQLCGLVPKKRMRRSKEEILQAQQAAFAQALDRAGLNETEHSTATGAKVTAKITKSTKRQLEKNAAIASEQSFISSSSVSSSLFSSPASVTGALTLGDRIDSKFFQKVYSNSIGSSPSTMITMQFPPNHILGESTNLYPKKARKNSSRPSPSYGLIGDNNKGDVGDIPEGIALLLAAVEKSAAANLDSAMASASSTGSSALVNSQQITA
jgi:hypothetical protein